MGGKACYYACTTQILEETLNHFTLGSVSLNFNNRECTTMSNHFWRNTSRIYLSDSLPLVNYMFLRQIINIINAFNQNFLSCLILRNTNESIFTTVMLALQIILGWQMVTCISDLVIQKLPFKVGVLFP